MLDCKVLGIVQNSATYFTRRRERLDDCLWGMNEECFVLQYLIRSLN
jgi:hypothetical protein